MHVENGACVGTGSIEHKVQAGFSGGLARAAKNRATGIHLKQARGRERSFVEAARGDQDASVDTHAEVAAGRGNPSLRVAPARGGTESFSGGLERIRIGDHAYPQCNKGPGWTDGAHSRRRRFYNESLLAEDQRDGGDDDRGDHNRGDHDRLDVVLASPRNPLNIGAVARAMANFGFSRLVVAAPYAPHWREARSAVGAPELLRNARETGSLAEAVSGCTLVAGTGTLTYRKPEQRVVPLPEFAPLVQREMANGGRVALVFGPEKHGLTREDLSFCNLLVEIPTDAQQPSMNLGQAVAVCLYEVASRCFSSVEGARTGSGVRPLRKKQIARMGHGSIIGDSTDQVGPAAHSGRLELLAGVVEKTMIAADYSPASMREANRHDLRLLLRRLSPTERDTRRILGLFRRILWRLER